MNLWIKNGHVLDPANHLDEVCDVYVKEGKVACVGSLSSDKIPDECTVIDAEGKYVMPGLVDLHVHLREPGFEYKETIYSGTHAMAKGGFTAVCPMPNTKPVTDSPAMIEKILKIAKTDSPIRVYPVGAVTKGQLGEEMTDIAGMVKAGAKAISEDGKSVMNAEIYREAMKEAKKAGIPVLAHCEDKNMVGHGAMNAGEKAKELGMNDTNFVNCHGLDEDDHLTSAYDIALMSRELLTKHPQITNYTTIWTDSLRDGKSALSNTNKLVRNYSGCTGLKTGSTSKALFNLSASATRNDLSLISVIMKAPTSAIRFSNASTLLDYGFNTFSYKSFATKGEVFKSIPVTKGTADTINAIYESSPSFLIKKGEESSITYEINLPESIQAPITQGQQLGTISYYLNNDKIAEVSLIAENSINKISFINIMKSLFSNWFNLTRSS